MPLPFHLGLRNNRDRVTLLKGNGRGEVLGTASPETVDRRLRVLDDWGLASRSPRRTELHTIDLPLPTRSQTILSHRLDPAFQARLNSGMYSPMSSRRAAEPGVTARLHLDNAPVAFPFRPRPVRR